MAEAPNALTEHVVDVEAGEHVVAAAFLGGEPALALAGGVVKFSGRAIAAHPDAAILCAALDGDRLLTGGDDGRVVATDSGGRNRDARR